MQNEEWLPVVGYEDLYLVSSYGRIKSLQRLVMRKDGRSYVTEERIRKPGCGKTNPYMTVSLSRAAKNTMHSVHSLVLCAFVGPMPIGQEACHGDGDPSNNHKNNLRWDTRKSNHADKNIHGTGTVGERHPMARLTDGTVAALRKRHIEGASITTLANEFQVTRATAWRAAKHISWSHI